jgi:hypothetical protein
LFFQTSLVLTFYLLCIIASALHNSYNWTRECLEKYIVYIIIQITVVCIIFSFIHINVVFTFMCIIMNKWKNWAEKKIEKVHPRTKRIRKKYLQRWIETINDSMLYYSKILIIVNYRIQIEYKTNKTLT